MTQSAKKLPSHARIVIVGGGVVGCSIAYQLTKMGVSDCLTSAPMGQTSGIA